MPKAKKRKPAKLTAAQAKTVGQFNDHRHEHPKLTFEQVSLKVLRNKFEDTENGKLFEAECRRVFDGERDV
jgi:hypothetical protein